MKPLDTVLYYRSLTYQFHHLNILSPFSSASYGLSFSVIFFPVYDSHLYCNRISIHQKTFRSFDHLCLLPTRTIRSIFDCPILDGSEMCLDSHTHMHTRTPLIFVSGTRRHTRIFFRFHNSQYKAINIFFPPYYAMYPSFFHFLSLSVSLVFFSDYYKSLVLCVYSPFRSNIFLISRTFLIPKSSFVYG